MTLEQELELYIQEYRANYTSPEAIRSLQKTFQSHNITIEDWNSLITFIDANTRTSAIDDIYTFLPKLLEQVDANTTDISGKTDKVNSATNGHLAGLDSSGNLTDSGIAADDVQKKVGPLPGYTLSRTQNIIDFITTNDLNDKTIILNFTTGVSSSPIIGKFKQVSGTTYQFELESIGEATRYIGTENLASKSFFQILTSTYREDYEISKHKVTSLSSSSTDTQYPSAKCVYDNLTAKSGATNSENGTGTNAVRQKMADATVNFTGRNPVAESLDPTISATINTGASGSQSSAFGKNTMALATASFTNGNKALAKGEESHAEGYQSVTLGDGSHAEGNVTVTVGTASHSEGTNTVAHGAFSHSEGKETVAYGENSHAEGNLTAASGYGSHVEGQHSYTGDTVNQPTNRPQDSGGSGGSGGGGGSSTENQQGAHAHAEGYYCCAIGNHSHAEGYVSDAMGLGSHVEGGWNTANGELSHVEGKHNIANGYCSHISGLGNTTGYAYQTVIGRYNSNEASSIFEIGWGTDESHRANVFRVLQNGTAELDSTGVTNKSVVTKKYVDDAVRDAEIGVGNVVDVKVNNISVVTDGTANIDLTNYAVIYSHSILMKNASNEEYIINVICSRSSPITAFSDLPAQAYFNGDFRINVGFAYLYGRVTYYSPNASGAFVAGYVLDDRNNAFTYSSIASQQMTFVSDTVTAI